MNTKTKQQIIATLLKAQRPDLANVVAAPKKKNIDNTPYSATAVSDGLVSEIMDYLRVKHPDLDKQFGEKLWADRDYFADALEKQANQVYQNNAPFAKKLDGSGDARPYFRGFVQHWFASLLNKKYKAVFQALPREFGMGHPLPVVGSTVADFRPGSFYDFIPKAVTAVKGLAQAMFKDQRDEDEMADTLVAILKKSVPQSVQSTVFKAMKHLM